MFSKRSYARIRMAVCPRALSVGSAILFVFLGLVYSTTAAPLAIQHVVDFNGDGRTDISVVRNVNGSIVWFNYDGVSIPPAGITYNYFGLAATDFLTPADYDGDGKTDIAVWRPGAGGVAAFYILQSTTNTVRAEQFGQTNDDPSVVADYDGDGKADPAVFRCPVPTAPAGQCFFYYRGSRNNPSGAFTSVAWGFGHDNNFFPYQGDFDGDGKADFCIQRADPNNPNQGQFVLLRSSDGGVEYIPWGFFADTLVPGDYDGDGRADFCVRRNSGGFASFYVLLRTGSAFYQQWGITNDVSVPGDYDGDGKTDFAVWRGSATPGQTSFYILNSLTRNPVAFQWGQCPASGCDVPVANWIVH